MAQSQLILKQVKSRNSTCECSVLLPQFVNITPSLNLYNAHRAALLAKVFWKDRKCFIFATYQFKCTCQQAQQDTILKYCSYESLSA